MDYRRCSTPFPEPLLVTCTCCGEDFPEHINFANKVCSACEFVNDILAQAKTSCGVVVIESYRLWTVPDAAPRFEKRGWTIELAVPSRLDVLRGKLTIRFKAKDVGCCSGKADTTPRCYETRCGTIPTPDAVHDVKQAGCRKSCPVAAFTPKTTAINALTRRCCTALSQITVDSVAVKIERQDVPAVIGAVANLRAAGWTVSITDTFRSWSIGNITIYPKSFDK
jgi:hypothetical protein